MVRDKCLVSEMTSNTNADCDRMFFPEFREVLDYCVKRFKEKYCSSDDDDGTELIDATFV